MVQLSTIKWLNSSKQPIQARLPEQTIQLRTSQHTLPLNYCYNYSMVRITAYLRESVWNSYGHLSFGCTWS